ncbi:hypothetical protein ALNOE001_16800 [Candidatus Methanobinarius endosymbioticus]|uniref:Uncharacterized protein n=1 Tax=Candidatus Methanobinarius endosymbioticus TaxID=2006182 RepID=A0A366M9W6_9EURY|nr:hypothetical protein ALNOE001_16800 [Candidatus Methanobinarius endosymbioticus]
MDNNKIYSNISQFTNEDVYSIFIVSASSSDHIFSNYNIFNNIIWFNGTYGTDISLNGGRGSYVTNTSIYGNRIVGKMDLLSICLLIRIFLIITFI